MDETSEGLTEQEAANEPTSETTVTYIQAISMALEEEMRRDESVLFLGQDVARYGGAFKMSLGMVDEFGEDRVINTPIAESGAIGMAIGAALLGQRPVVEMQFSDFVACGFNQLVNVAAKMYYRIRQPVPLVVRLPSGGGVGAGPFHSQSTEAWFLHVSGLKVVTPAFPEDAYLLLKAAIRDPNPVLFFEHKYLYRRTRGVLPQCGEELSDVRLSRVQPGARVVHAGSDVTLLTYSGMVHRALEAARLLEQEGVSLEIVDLRVLAPLDEETIFAAVEKTGRVLIVHEATQTCGFGSELAARVANSCFEFLDAPVKRIGYPDIPVPFHPRLEATALPGVETIAAAVRELMAY